MKGIQSNLMQRCVCVCRLCRGMDGRGGVPFSFVGGWEGATFKVPFLLATLITRIAQQEPSELVRLFGPILHNSMLLNWSVDL